MKRSLTILCAAALLQCLSFTLTAGVANAARPKSANVSQAGIAQRLAGAAADAGSPAAATKAVLSVLKTLQIGVYDTRGRAIQRGAERGVRDLYLYDFEVKAIADALARHQTFGLANLGDLLSRVTGKQISAELLGTVLRAGVGTAIAHPAAPSALLPLLVRDLGLRDHPASDPAANVPASSLELDPLQYFLLTASFLGEPLRQNAATGAHIGAAADVRAVAAADPCPVVKPDPNARNQMGDSALKWWVGKTVTKGSATIARAVNVKKLAENVVGGLHGSVIAYSLRIVPLDTSLSTHYGPAGSDPSPLAGKPMNFRVQVVMLDDLGERTIRCLALAGIKVPNKGPVPDVPVMWTSAQGNLKQHGSFTPAAGVLGAKTTTDGGGIAQLMFTPKEEAVPGLGVDTHDTGVVDAIPLWQDATGNKLGVGPVKLNQFLTPMSTGIRWDVGYHSQLGSLEIVSDRSYSNGIGDPVGGQVAYGFHYGLHALVPFDGTGVGTGSLDWSALEETNFEFRPYGQGKCDANSVAPETIKREALDSRSGTVHVTNVTGKPDISVTFSIEPAAYTRHEVDDFGCGKTVKDTPELNDGAFTGLAAQGRITSPSQLVFQIDGWTRGVPGSGVFATKTLELIDGTVTLKIVGRAG